MQKGVKAGATLRELRAERGLTQKEAARLIGWKDEKGSGQHTYLSRYETDAEALGVVIAKRIVRAYSKPPWPKVTLADLGITEDGAMSPSELAAEVAAQRAQLRRIEELLQELVQPR